MVLTWSHPPKGSLTRWRSIACKCRDGSPTVSDPLPYRFSLRNRADRHSWSFSCTRDGWLLFGSSPPRLLSTPLQPVSAGLSPLYLRPGRQTPIGPCAHPWIPISCHSTGRLPPLRPCAHPSPGGRTTASHPSPPWGPLLCPVNQLHSSPRSPGIA